MVEPGVNIRLLRFGDAQRETGSEEIRERAVLIVILGDVAEVIVIVLPFQVNHVRRRDLFLEAGRQAERLEIVVGALAGIDEIIVIQRVTEVAQRAVLRRRCRPENSCHQPQTG